MHTKIENLGIARFLSCKDIQYADWSVGQLLPLPPVYVLTALTFTLLTHMARVELVMPKMGESIMEATILKWNKKVGDTVELDEPVLDIATDKVDSEIPSPVSGVLVEILYQ